MNDIPRILAELGFMTHRITGDVVSTDRGEIIVRPRSTPIRECTILSLAQFKEEGTAWAEIKAGRFSFYLTYHTHTGQYTLVDLAEVRSRMEGDFPHRMALNAIGIPNGNAYRALPAGVGVVHSNVNLPPAGITPKTDWLHSIEYVGLTLLPTELAGPGDVYEWRSSEGKKYIGEIYTRQEHMVELGRARWVSLNNELGGHRILRRES